MPDTNIKISGLTILMATPTEINQKMIIIERAINDGLSTASQSDQSNQREGLTYRNPNIQDGVISFWSHNFMCMGA